MMSEYTLIVRILQAGNKEISYSITLSTLYESYPEDYFRQENNRSLISQTIEQQLARMLTSENLTAIISNWIADIKVGRHRTIVTLDLPIDASVPIQPVIPINNPVNNPIVAPAKKPLRPVVNPTSEIKTANISTNKVENSPNSNTEKTPEPVTDIRTDTNKADF
ncbi:MULTISPECIES: hypothetical protein [Aphanizomenonaceae]|uniref:hypothetical protein n=1 Tax=Aphanizomenonaceae TaxID=1892259 RepID=UPI001267B826|nr:MULTISPECIES: hypothetical protein [Aphanizomenonaceae]MBE9259242.1 hypothetical protein [Dolichospermum sp. LEGE 00246]